MFLKLNTQCIAYKLMPFKACIKRLRSFVFTVKRPNSKRFLQKRLSYLTN